VRRRPGDDLGVSGEDPCTRSRTRRSASTSSRRLPAAQYGCRHLTTECGRSGRRFEARSALDNMATEACSLCLAAKRPEQRPLAEQASASNSVLAHDAALSRGIQEPMSRLYPGRGVTSLVEQIQTARSERVRGRHCQV
jgi:hypothetical protein